MTVSAQTPVNSSTGNGATTVFPYTFKVLAAADLEVTIDGVVQTLTTHYSVSGVGSDGGGNVTFVTAPANGTTVVRRRNMAFTRTVDYQNQGDLRSDVLNPDQDAPVLMVQQLQEQINRTIRLPAGEAASQLDDADTRAGKYLGFDPTTGTPALLSGSGTSTDAANITFTPAGTGGVETTAQAKLRQVVNTKDFGAASGNTNAHNKAALQAAISALNAADGGQIVVDYDINYGLKTRTPSTWPDFTGITKPIIILDYSRGDTQAPNVYPTAYDGAMYRVWTHTPQTTSPGQHDGNTQWLRGAWAPAFCVSNDANIAAVGDPSRTAMDNRRAFYATMVDGKAAWQWGQGTQVGAGLTDEEMSNWVLQKFDLGGETRGDYTSLLVERKTGHISYGGGRNIPGASHHFESPITGQLQAIFENSHSTTSTVVLRPSGGSGDDVYLQSSAGDFIVNIPTAGEALRVNKADRYVGIGATASYRFDLAESRDTNYVERIRNTSATNGSIARWESSSASGSGWNFLNAYSSGTSDVEFQLNGNGTGYCDGSWTGGGADYAEYFEWADGNATNEDRRGFSVTLDGNKIRKALPGDTVIGVISGNPSVVGDSAWNKWAGKYLRDDFGSYVLDADGHRVLNPAFDPEADYTPRSQRPEWGCVGLMGKLRLRKGQPVDPRWIKMRDVSASVEEWLVR